VEFVEARPAECIPAKSAEPALIGTGSIGDSDGNEKEAGVGGASSKVILPHGAARGEDRSREEVRPVSPARTPAGLLYARKNGKRRATRQRRNAQKLPTRREQRPQCAHDRRPVEGKLLNRTECCNVRSR